MLIVIEKVLDFIGGMNILVLVFYLMDESIVKGILKYLYDLGVLVSLEVVVVWGEQEGWNFEFMKKVVGWVEKVVFGNCIFIKNLEYFLIYMQEQFKEFV